MLVPSSKYCDNDKEGDRIPALLAAHSALQNVFTCKLSVSYSYCLWADERGVRVQVPVGSEFSLHHIIQAGSGSHPASYPMGTGGSFPRGVKRQGREADHSPPTNAEVKKMWIYTSTPPYAFMAYYLTVL
jgi:hypothetical protein